MKANTELEQRFGGRLDTTSMKDFDYKGKPVYWLRFSGGHCPICGEANGWCVVNVTGTKVICMKTPNDHPVGQGYLYYLKDSKPIKFDSRKIKRDTTYAFAKPSIAGEVNRLVAEHYALSEKDRRNLNARGLDDAHIRLHADGGFGTLKSGPQAIQYETRGKFHSIWYEMFDKAKLSYGSWRGVMGFFGFTIDQSGRQSYEIPVYHVTSLGMLIPYFSIYNEILGFQVRLSNPPVKAVPKGKKGPNDGLLVEKGLELTVEFRNYQREYEIIAKTYKGRNVIATGFTAGKKEISGTIRKGDKTVSYSFELKPENKYRWISSRNQEHGAAGHGKHMPVEVAYNDKIAKLSSRIPCEKAMLDNYIEREKGVWLTEGGLKALVTAANLSKQFSDAELDVYGRDVLAVAGVTSYADFLPVLKKMHVVRATVAFDMDLIENDNVLTSTTNLVNLLIDNGIEVYLTSWDGKKAKGIDDALAGGVKVGVEKL